MNTPTPLGKQTFAEYEKELKDFKEFNLEKVQLSVVSDLKDNVKKIQALSKQASSMYKTMSKDTTRIQKQLQDFKNGFKADEKQIKEMFSKIDKVVNDSEKAINAAEKGAKELGGAPGEIDNYATLDIEVGDIDGNYADLKDVLSDIQRISSNL